MANDSARDALRELLDAQEGYARAQLAEENATNNYSGSTRAYSRKTVDAMVRVSNAEKSARAVLAATPAVRNGTRLWLWRNGDHFLAFTHLYPCFSPGGDPMTLGEPAAWAEFRASHDRA
jgi:hypothetical protein